MKWGRRSSFLLPTGIMVSEISQSQIQMALVSALLVNWITVRHRYRIKPTSFHWRHELLPVTTVRLRPAPVYTVQFRLSLF